MENPISSKARGRLYVAGIVIGALATVFGPLSQALGLSDEWSSVVTSVVGALILITNTLSKANLTADTDTATIATTVDADTATSEAIDVTAALSEVDSQIQAEEAPVGDVDDPTGALTDSE